MAEVSVAVPPSIHEVRQYRFRGTFAYGQWQASSGATTTYAYINVSETTEGSHLFADEFTVSQDANGVVTYIETYADVTSGFTFDIKSPTLASASVSGTDLPATTYMYDADWNMIGTSPTTITLTANWTGQGDLTHSVSNYHYASGSYRMTSHWQGTDRNATATTTIGSDVFGAADYAGLATTRDGSTTISFGGGRM